VSQTIESVAILGGGFMGAGIAESASIAGVPVIIRELPEFIDTARARLEKSLDGAVKRGKLDAGQRDATLANITFTSELASVASACSPRGSDVAPGPSVSVLSRM